jgi:nucleotide-binding universal stress UspA family protein
MKRIVAPIDFSEVSLNAARYAANMAAYLNLPLQLMHVTVLPMSYGPTSVPLALDDDLEAMPTERLKKFSQVLHDEMRGQVDIELIHRTGSAVYEIMSHCNHTRPFAVVLGSHGDSDLTRFLLGSTTIGLIRECSSPVIVIPKDFSFTPPKKIALASDFQHVTKTTPSQYIHNMVTSLGAELEILHIENKAEPLEEVAEVISELNNIFTTEKPKIRIIKNVETEETLLDYAKAHSFDLLIVVPRKHNWFELVIKRQHTNNIALHATVPVMLLKNED